LGQRFELARYDAIITSKQDRPKINEGHCTLLYLV
jgi:hypothetical protein